MGGFNIVEKKGFVDAEKMALDNILYSPAGVTHCATYIHVHV